MAMIFRGPGGDAGVQPLPRSMRNDAGRGMLANAIHQGVEFNNLNTATLAQKVESHQAPKPGFSRS